MKQKAVVVTIIRIVVIAGGVGDLSLCWVTWKGLWMPCEILFYDLDSSYK